MFTIGLFPERDTDVLECLPHIVCSISSLCILADVDLDLRLVHVQRIEGCPINISFSNRSHAQECNRIQILNQVEGPLINLLHICRKGDVLQFLDIIERLLADFLDSRRQHGVVSTSLCRREGHQLLLVLTQQEAVDAGVRSVRLVDRVLLQTLTLLEACRVNFVHIFRNDNLFQALALVESILLDFLYRYRKLNLLQCTRALESTFCNLRDLCRCGEGYFLHGACALESGTLDRLHRSRNIKLLQLHCTHESLLTDGLQIRGSLKREKLQVRIGIECARFYLLQF